MDYQLPHMPSVGSSSLGNAKTPSRPEVTASASHSSRAGKSFTSELHAARAKESPAERKRPLASGQELDDIKQSKEPSTTTVATDSQHTQDTHASPLSVEPSRSQSDPVLPTAVSDVTTQSIVLALAAIPANTPTKPVLPSVSEEETSMADPSLTAQAGMPMTPSNATAINSLGVGVTGLVDARESTRPKQADAPTLHGRAQSDLDIPGEVSQEKPAIPLMLEELTTQPTDLPSIPQTSSPAPQELGNPTAAGAPPNLVRQLQDAPKEAMPLETAGTSAAWQEVITSDAQSGMEWSGRDQRDESPGNQPFASHSVPEGDTTALPSGFNLTVNGVDQKVFSSASSLHPRLETQPAVSVHPLQSTDWLPENSASQIKSMVLELSQADLGRINIRVAVNQDVVHTFFSSDHREMSQYLLSGQEKLQSALQISGLDLGQFHVDVNRHNAERSFQQQTPHGGAEEHARQGDSRENGQGREESTRDTAPRRGMLNLVA